MRLSKRTEYGICAIVQLAPLWPHGFVQSRDLAKRESLPSKFLEAILLALRRGGFIESKIGRDGGYRLSRAPHEINVGELVRRLEGRLTVTETRSSNDLSPGGLAIHLLNAKLTEATDAALHDMTLAQLFEHASKAGNLQQMYYI